jgi:hypothetical protein
MERIVSIGSPGGELLDPVDESFLLEAEANIFTSQDFPKYYTEMAGTVTVYPAPAKDTQFYVFGKKVFPGLATDDATSVLRNCDSAIMAFAQSDMLQRSRQYEKGKYKYQEALALLETAKSVERDQANRPRRNKNLTVVGNSLAEMTDAVCGICGQWTPDIRILVREFLRRNYVALYQLMLWPESTVVVKVGYTGEQVILPHFVDRVIAARTADGFTLMPNDVSYLFAVSPMVFEGAGAAISMSILTPVGVGSLPANPPEGLLITSSEGTDGGKRVFIRGETGGTEVMEEVILGPLALTPVQTRYAYDVPLTISKPVTDGDITVNGLVTTELYEFIPRDEYERKHQRVWLLPPPSASTVLDPSDCEKGVLILGKRQITPLRTEEDTPIITGAQNVLVAAAAADLWGRLGNLDLSQKYSTRAEAATKALVSENTDQSAYCPKIVPVIEPMALGIGDDYCWSKV